MTSPTGAPPPAPGVSPDSTRTEDGAYAGGRRAMRVRHALSQDLEDVSNAHGLPVPKGALPVNSNTAPCYFQHPPCYGINREGQNIPLISNATNGAFWGKTADNREEKIFLPCSALGTGRITTSLTQPTRARPRLRSHIRQSPSGSARRARLPPPARSGLL